MAKDVDEVLKATIDQLSSLPEKELSHEEVCDFIESQIKQAFKQVGEDDKNDLFKKLSRVLAQDRLETKNSALFNYLQPLGLTSIPQQIVNNFQKKDNYTELEGLTLRQKITKNAIIALQKIQNFLANLDDKHQEYVQPFKTFARIAIFLHVAALIIALIPVAVGIVLVFVGAAIINSIQDFLFNKITGNQFDIEKDNYIESSVEYAHARRQYLEEVRDLFIKQEPVKRLQYESMTYDDLMEAYVINQAGHSSNRTPKAQAEREETERRIIKNDIKARISSDINILTKLSLLAKTIFHNLLKPLPQGVFNKLASIVIVKPFQFLTSTFLLASMTGVEAFCYLTLAIGLSGVALTYGFHVGALLLINSPLFVIDAFRACFKPANSEKQSQEAVEEFDYSRGSSSSTILTIMPPQQSPIVNISQDHGQSSQSSENMNAVQEAEDDNIYGQDVWLTPSVY